MRVLKLFFIVSVLLIVFSCGKDKPVYVETELDKIIKEYIYEDNFSVILADMNYDESSDKYFHDYNILIEKPYKGLSEEEKMDTLRKAEDVQIVKTGLKEVDAVVFDENLENLGMTILSKKNGVLDRNVSPAGMDNYVGNERYGHWQTHSNGSSFWSFYGPYLFMSHMFHGVGGYGYSRSSYDNYDRNYRGRSSYNDGGKYGTSSATNKNTTWGKKNKSFKENVRSKVSKSATSLKSKGYSSSSSYSKTSRTDSRYSSGSSSSSSSRSRSGGFGK